MTKGIYKRSEEHKKKLSEIRKIYLRNHTEALGGIHQWKNKLHPRGMLGKHHSEETKRKMKENNWSKKGFKHSMLGKHHTRETIEKISANKERSKKISETRKKLFEEGKLRVNLNFIGNMKNRKKENCPMYGKHHSNESKKKMSVKAIERTLHFPKCDTLPEVLMQNGLKLEKIIFQTQRIIPCICKSDIFIEPNICIFVDGDYWHNLPNYKIRDSSINVQLMQLGYVVLRFWEHDIKNNLDFCINKIKEVIQ